jgi:hypothetical protein
MKAILWMLPMWLVEYINNCLRDLRFYDVNEVADARWSCETNAREILHFLESNDAETIVFFVD